MRELAWVALENRYEVSSEYTYTLGFQKEQEGKCPGSGQGYVTRLLLL